MHQRDPQRGDYDPLFRHYLSRVRIKHPGLFSKAVNIDDFVDQLVNVFNESTVTKMHAALHSSVGRAVQLIPTHYYGSKGHMVLDEHPWLARRVPSS